MLATRPKIVFVDLYDNEIFPAPYKEPDLSGVAKQGVNGQLITKPAALTNKEQRTRYELAMAELGSSLV